MSSPFRRMIGSLVLVVYIVVYCLFAMAIGDVIVATKSGWVQFVYFLTAGLAWVPLAAVIVKWMYRRVAPPTA